MTAAAFRYFFEAILNPFFLGFLLLTLSIVWVLLHGDGRMARSCLLFSFAGFLLLSTGWLPSVLTAVLEKQYSIVMRVDPSIHWIVVLGGGHNGERVEVPANELLSAVSIERLVEGVRLYRKLPYAKLLMSGGAMRPKEKTSEAAYLANVVSWFDIPRNNVVLEDGSFNTADEAVAIKKIVRNEPFYLVTSAVHMPRSMALCHRQGLHPIAAPIDYLSRHISDGPWEDRYLPNARNLVRSNTAWHELLGLFWGRARGLL